MPYPFPCSPVIGEWLWKNTKIEKNKKIIQNKRKKKQEKNNAKKFPITIKRKTAQINLIYNKYKWPLGKYDQIWWHNNPRRRTYPTSKQILNVIGSEFYPQVSVINFNRWLS